MKITEFKQLTIYILTISIYVINLVFSLVFGSEFEALDLVCLLSSLIWASKISDFIRKEEMTMPYLISAEYDDNPIGYFLIFSYNMLLAFAAIVTMWA